MNRVRKVKELEKIIRDQAFVVRVQDKKLKQLYEAIKCIDKDYIHARDKNEKLRMHLTNINLILIEWDKD